MRVRFAQSARKHKVGRASARFVIDNTTPTETTASSGDLGLLWIGEDERGRELEVLGLVREADPENEDPRKHEARIIVIHVMPTDYRKQGK